MSKPYPRRRPESAAEAKQLREWLATQVAGITRDQWHESYCSWARGGNGWQPALRWDGGTTIRYCLAWYQFRHRPGSKEWRPSLIVEAACLAAGLPLTYQPAAPATPPHEPAQPYPTPTHQRF